MKRCALVVLLLIIVIASVHALPEDPVRRGLFVMAFQDPEVLASREEIARLIDFSRRSGIKDLFLQVYHANRAWFPSGLADRSPYDRCLESLGEDPLRLLISQAHLYGIRVHAWMNLLSLGSNKDSPMLKRYGPDILTVNRSPKRVVDDYKIDGQYFLEPGEPKVRDELVKIVDELVSGYPDLDGVQFDYIRYPDTRPAYGYSDTNIARFKGSTGCDKAEECSKAWKEWKRAQVTETLELVVAKARERHPGLRVSATGCMPYVRAHYEAFQDWPSWLRRGTVDFVTLMSYSPYPDEFERWITKAKGKVSDMGKIVVGIGAYKMKGSPGVLARELEICSKFSECGIAIFHYGTMLEDPSLAETLSIPYRKGEI